MKKRKLYLQAVMFLLPSLIILILFVYKPLLSSLWYAFVDFENFKPNRFVGLDNYRFVFGNKVFWNSLQLTFKWVFMNALLPTFAGLILSILIDVLIEKRRAAEVSRTILFLPQMMSLVAVGLLWRLVYDPNIGMISGILQLSGVKGKVNILGDVQNALYYSFIPVLWQSMGFSMVIFSAALQGISTDIIEAAKTEGANKYQLVRYIMFPSIITTVFTVISINMISGFKAFDLLYTLTKGGPGTATQISAIYSYNQAFQSYRFDYASVIQSVLLAAVILMVVLYNMATRPVQEKYSA